MQISHGIARCLCILMQGLNERRDPLSEDTLVATCALGCHFSKAICVPMQDASDLLLRCAPLIPEILRDSA